MRRGAGSSRRANPERLPPILHRRRRLVPAAVVTRPRDLRSSFITLQIYASVPLTTIAKQCGTSVPMIEKHYAGVIENWDGIQVPAEDQIRAARASTGRVVDVTAPQPRLRR